jgi:hypothetical protein
MVWEYTARFVYARRSEEEKERYTRWYMVLEEEEQGAQRLSEALRIMGRRGWELAGIHTDELRYAGGWKSFGGSSWHNPSHLYVFKRPVTRGEVPAGEENAAGSEQEAPG